MRNHITILQIALALGMAAVVIFLFTQPALAAHGGSSSSHGMNFGNTGGNPSQPDNTVGTKGNPIVHPYQKPVNSGNCMPVCRSLPGTSFAFCQHSCGVGR